jgi:hypothetical protein
MAILDSALSVLPNVSYFDFNARYLRVMFLCSDGYNLRIIRIRYTVQGIRNRFDAVVYMSGFFVGRITPSSFHPRFRLLSLFASA